ncbi:MAG: anthranilate synthase component I [Bacteroidota bacterium]
MITSFEDFKKLAIQGNVVPIVDELLADTETPVSVYLKIGRESPYSFLLESIDGGERLARYSFLGFNPFMIFRINGKKFSIEPLHSDVTVLPALVKDIVHPLDALKTIFHHLKAVPVPGLPRFSGGAVGYLGYETVQLVENLDLPNTPELPYDDGVLMFYDTILVFDNVQRKIFIVSNGYISTHKLPEDEIRTEYRKVVAEITRIKSILQRQVTPHFTTARFDELQQWSMSEKEYLGSVERCKEYIRAGDIFQVVLSQRLTQKIQADAFDVYRMLRVVNPSPYAYFLRIGDTEIIGSSPELLVRVDNGIVETRPIAGTTRRGRTSEEDAKLEVALLANEKERAEHLMLVDLGRNDLGRICDYGSVAVTEFMAIERYSHVMHIVSNVRGKLRADMSAIDALYSCFPAGTLSGAPKIRAMEIIAELEKAKRGVYGGAIGYIDFAGNLDSCIAIRTIVMRDGVARLQAGAGIVYDSEPASEYQESLDKMGALVQSFQMLPQYSQRSREGA